MYKMIKWIITDLDGILINYNNYNYILKWD